MLKVGQFPIGSQLRGDVVYQWQHRHIVHIRTHAHKHTADLPGISSPADPGCPSSQGKLPLLGSSRWRCSPHPWGDTDSITIRDRKTASPLETDRQHQLSWRDPEPSAVNIWTPLWRILASTTTIHHDLIYSVLKWLCRSAQYILKGKWFTLGEYFNFLLNLWLMSWFARGFSSSKVFVQKTNSSLSTGHPIIQLSEVVMVG